MVDGPVGWMLLTSMEVAIFVDHDQRAFARAGVVGLVCEPAQLREFIEVHRSVEAVADVAHAHACCNTVARATLKNGRP